MCVGPFSIKTINFESEDGFGWSHWIERIIGIILRVKNEIRGVFVKTRTVDGKCCRRSGDLWPPMP